MAFEYHIIKHQRDKQITIVYRANIQLFNLNGRLLILLLVEKEIVLGRVVRPDVLDALVGLAVVLKFLKVLDYLLRGAGTVGVVNKFVFGCRPWSIVQAAGEFKCPIHIKKLLKSCC